jgi:beta-lactamase class D
MSFRLLLVLLCWMSATAIAGTARWDEHPEWSQEFSDRGVKGAALIYDEHEDRYLSFDRKRAETPFLPASTFKIFNALVGLETAAVRDEHELFRWDGKKRWVEEWNRDNSLASGMKYSTVWFYQELARRIGEPRMQAWIDKVGYGNRDIGGGIDQFWLTGKLRISAVQQVDFLRRLADGSLPFSARSQETVRRITIVESAPGYTIHAKTGWGVHAAADGSTDLGWYVGWIERTGRRWFFAINMDLPGDDSVERIKREAPRRVEVTRALLVRSGALPSP